jgi:hypothetical protein
MKGNRVLLTPDVDVLLEDLGARSSLSRRQPLFSHGTILHRWIAGCINAVCYIIMIEVEERTPFRHKVI